MVVIGNKGMTETNINARALMLTESQIVGLLGVFVGRGFVGRGCFFYVTYIRTKAQTCVPDTRTT